MSKLWHEVLPDREEETVCFICKKGDEKLKYRRFTPILPGWPKDWGEPEEVLRLCHGSCYQDWYNDIYWEYAELDRSLNECAGFVRSGAYDGVLEFEDGKYPCKSWYRGEEMENIYPELRNKDWWKPRRQR